ncbi:Pyrroline-5-carboxylate reductase [Anaerovibrio sp. JC8]|uniref:pyrroline-5-carboxylate reductase n=1 Tax=Anaerovibrio sp. JC8 TaxID=1240085 RepID=UPI000A09B9AA|nr:pyrroline-5-carboxylate reductase [Anaerovibrio sp. JC8]ORU00700.1 Pyrroline-5-carboxylate reductase [Anaerovibrio sp. JC8]
MKIGFIGGGAMGEAILSGVLSNGSVSPKDVFVSEIREDRCKELKDKHGVNAVTDNDFVKTAGLDILILAVKPQVVTDAMESLKGKVPDDVLVGSIVAGLPIKTLEKYFPENPIVRIMPNTPLAVGEGMSAYARNERASGKATVKAIRDILYSCGQAVEVKERMMDAVTGLSGSGPAYGFLMIDALADGGVAAGLPRQTAILLAAQTLLGAAKMVVETGKHPDVLRDQVTSPAGTTIEGVRVMEQRGVRGALIDAVLAATDRSKELGK